MVASVHVRAVPAEKAAGAATLGEIAIEAISAKVKLELAAEGEGQDRIEGRAEIASRAADEGLKRIRSGMGFDSAEIICGACNQRLRIIVHSANTPALNSSRKWLRRRFLLS